VTFIHFEKTISSLNLPTDTIARQLFLLENPKKTLSTARVNQYLSKKPRDSLIVMPIERAVKNRIRP
jgi:hypothetical protein